MAHENLLREEVVESSTDRVLGYVFAGVFGLIGIVPALFGRGIVWWSLIVAAVFAGVAAVFPVALAPLNRLWTEIGLLLHRIVNPIVLGIMYYLVVTPTGLILRVLGKDPLRLRLDRIAATYWVDRTPPGPPTDSLGNQF